MWFCYAHSQSHSRTSSRRSPTFLSQTKLCGGAGSYGPDGDDDEINAHEDCPRVDPVFVRDGLPLSGAARTPTTTLDSPDSVIGAGQWSR